MAKNETIEDLQLEINALTEANKSLSQKVQALEKENIQIIEESKAEIKKLIAALENKPLIVTDKPFIEIAGKIFRFAFRRFFLRGKAYHAKDVMKNPKSIMDNGLCDILIERGVLVEEKNNI